MKKVTINQQELVQFFDYLQAKIDPVYQRETKQAISRFVEEQCDTDHPSS